MEKNLSVILIARNEEASIGSMIEGLLNSYSSEIMEIIAVDDASTDRTAAIVQVLQKSDARVKLIRRSPPCGVGRALKTGFQNINPKADYALSMDSDFVENLSDVRSLIDAVEKNGYDGVIGSRFIDGGQVIGYPGQKKMMNRMFHFIVRFLFGIKQRDLTNNFKLYKREIFQSLPWKSDGFAMNAETGILPVVSSYRIGEVPISWINRKPGMGLSKFRLFRHGWGYVQVIAFTYQFLKSRNLKKSPS